MLNEDAFKLLGLIYPSGKHNWNVVLADRCKNEFYFSQDRFTVATDILYKPGNDYAKFYVDDIGNVLEITPFGAKTYEHECELRNLDSAKISQSHYKNEQHLHFHAPVTNSMVTQSSFDLNNNLNNTAQITKTTTGAYTTKDKSKNWWSKNKGWFIPSIVAVIIFFAGLIAHKYGYI